MLAADSNVVSAPKRESARGQPVETWKQIIDPVEPFLEAVSARLTSKVQAFDANLIPYAQYALTGQGKHLRPALVALSANALSKPDDSHVAVAVIIEMVHLATLVHDDVMDEAEIRRGRLTVAANWSNEIAVLFGDCLFAEALTMASSFPTPDICRAVAMATNTVCAGEIIQTQRRRDFSLSRADYLKMLEMKTGELFALSCQLGAQLSGATPEQRTALRNFGMQFGTAYQIYDDCIDLFGSEEEVGKSLGTDLAKGKLTLPLLVLMEKATPADRRRVQALVEKWSTGSLKEISELLYRYDTLAPSLAVMKQHLDRAATSVEALPPTPGRTGLVQLTGFLARQTETLSSVPDSSL
jgi:octaprenyl-diphosphate synthase